MGVATVLLNVLALVEAGFELRAIVDKVKVMYSGGATDEQVSAYLKQLRDAALKELNDL